MKTLKQSFYSLSLIVLGIVFAIGVNIALAVWIGPSQNPPEGNVAEPFNVSSNTQILQGSKTIQGNQITDILYLGLGTAINGILGVNGITQFFSVPISAIFDGNVGIGTASPQAKLDVAGGVKIGSDNSVCDSTKEGTIRCNNADGCLEYCDRVNLDWSSVNPSCPVIPIIPSTCVSGSQDFLTPGVYSLDVGNTIKGCKFTFTIKGGGGASSGGPNGGLGGGIIIKNIEIPQTGTHSFGILVGGKGWGDGTDSKNIGGGGLGMHNSGVAYTGGGGASAVKLDSNVLAISGGGGASSYYMPGGAGGSGNSPGVKGEGNDPGIGGSEGIGGAAGIKGARGGNAGLDGLNGNGLGGLGYPDFMVGGGGGAGYYYGAGGGGGYGGGGGAGFDDYGANGAGGGGGYLNSPIVGWFFSIIPGAY